VYALDYIGFGVILAALLYAETFQPFHRMFALDDEKIQYPHAEHERVPTGILYIYAIAIPFGVITAYLLISRASAHKLHVSLLGLGITLVLTEFLTNIAKNAIGRPRPDFLDRCQPAPNTSKTGLVNYAVCTQKDEHTLQDGWRSFPSGHSSFSWAGQGYLALHLAGQLGALRTGASLPSLLVCLIPLITAAGIAISRLEDYRHDPYDVTAGSLLGFAVAYVMYRRYFPRLRSVNCGVPYALPTENLLLKQRDEEMGVGGVRDAGEYELTADDDENDDDSNAGENRLPRRTNGEVEQ
jgi:diacylglycerol diphosphate phosphatase / phosphatidate phosphatase